MRRRLLAPDVVKQMAKELEEEYAERLKAKSADADKVPKDLEEINDRIKRLRVRLAKGDPDMAPDELELAVGRAEQKRLELMHVAQGRIKVANAKVYAALPNAAKLYERRITKGLDGNAEEAATARQILKDLCGGKILLVPTPKGLAARSALHRDVLIREVSPSGSGGRI